MSSSAAQTLVDLRRIRANAQAIRDRARVPIIGVVKADGYGHGAVPVADAIADLVDCWYVFHPIEATIARLFDLTGKPTLAGAPAADEDVGRMRDCRVRPAAWTPRMAARFATLDPVLSVDTGMQRFACAAADLDAMFAAHPFAEAMTHASEPAHAARLRELMQGRGSIKLHAAGTALLDDAAARLDAVRPGLALYDGAARVSTRLVEARRSVGPVGYSGFTSTTHHGVVLLGYAHGLRAGPAVVNGRRQRIVEVGMQSAYVSLDAGDASGDEVVLLGDGLAAGEVAAAWGCGAHEATLRLASMGTRSYVEA